MALKFNLHCKYVKAKKYFAVIDKLKRRYTADKFKKLRSNN